MSFKANDIDYLRGPSCASIHLKDNMTVCILGEIHEKKPESEASLKVQARTVSINVYLDAIFSSTLEKKWVDVYLEVDHIDLKHPQRDNIVESTDRCYLLDTIKQWEVHLQILKSNLLPHVRMHYVDIRGSHIMKPLNRTICSLWKGRYKGVDMRNPISGDDCDKIEKFMDEVDTTATSLDDKKIMEYVTTLKVTRQIEAVKDEKLRGNIKIFFLDAGYYTLLGKKVVEVRTQLLALIAEIKKLDLRWRIPRISIPNILINKMVDIGLILVDWYAYLMDAYTMGRIFRSFKGDSRDISKDRHRLIITYTGNIHADRYRQFLNRAGFTTAVQISDNNQCLDLKLLKSHLIG
jgi:hypothetical protein